MAGSADSNDTDQQDQSADSESEQSISVPVRDPYVLFVATVRKILRSVSWLYERYSWLPGWTKVGGGVIIFLAGIYFDRQIQNALSFLVSATIGRFFGEFVQFTFGTQLILFLLLVLSIQAAIINYRLFVIENELTDGGMEIDLRLRPDGGHPPNHEEPDDTNQAGSSGSGALAGAATGAVLGSGFGPGGAIGGAILGAIVGDELEKSSIRQKRHREQIRTGGYEIETYTINTDPEGRVTPEILSKQIISVESQRQEQVYFHFNVRSETEHIQILTDDEQWTTEASIENLPVQNKEQVEFGIQQTSHRPRYEFDTLIIDIWVSNQMIEEFPHHIGSSYRNATNLATLRPQIPLKIE